MDASMLGVALVSTLGAGKLIVKGRMRADKLKLIKSLILDELGRIT